MGRYIVFKEVGDAEDKTLLSFRAGSYPNTLGRFLEENLPLRYENDTYYDLNTFKAELYPEINQKIEETKSHIILTLMKKDFDNYELLEWVKEYEELLEIRGGLGTIVELFETHKNELLISYG